MKFGKNIKLIGIPLVRCSKGAEIIIGDNVTIISSFRGNLVGLNRRTILSASKPDSRIVIGDNTGLSGTVIYAANSVTIGRWVNIGGNVSIWDTDFHPLDYKHRRFHLMEEIKTKPIHVGDDVFIGANSIILKGASIGNKSIIGAGSVVSKNIPENSVCAGNPAKLIKKI